MNLTEINFEEILQSEMSLGEAYKYISSPENSTVVWLSLAIALLVSTYYSGWKQIRQGNQEDINRGMKWTTGEAALSFIVLAVAPVWRPAFVAFALAKPVVRTLASILDLQGKRLG